MKIVIAAVMVIGLVYAAYALGKDAILTRRGFKKEDRKDRTTL